MKIKFVLTLFSTVFLNFQPILYSAEVAATPTIDPLFKEFLKPILMKDTTNAIAIIQKPENKKFINQQLTNGDTPLLIACKSGSTKIIEALLGAGANARIKNKTGISPISFAYDKIAPLTPGYDPNAFTLLKQLIDSQYPAERQY